MLERKTTLETLQFVDNGTILVRLKRSIVLDGEVLKEEWHRTSIPPDVDPEQQMAAVSAHLISMGFEACPAEQVQTIKLVSDRVHTAEVKAAYKARLDAKLIEKLATIVAASPAPSLTADRALGTTR